MSEEFFTCKTCGSKINKETGQTYWTDDGGNARKIEDVKKKFTDLQNEVTALKGENEKLKSKLENEGIKTDEPGKTGKDEDEGSFLDWIFGD